MSIKQTIIAILSAIILFLGGIGTQQLSSVGQGNEYNSTTTASMTGGIPLGSRTMRSVKPGYGAIGSVIVASTSPVALTLWDATSTTDIASTTIVTIATSTAAGTYQLDAVFNRGLFVDMPPAYIGGTVITWR